MAGIAEVGTVPSVSYLDTFFQRLPRDERFSEVSYTQFNSIVSLEAGTQLIFCLNATDPPFCYDISDCLISATVRITKEDGSLPNKEALVYPVNSSLLSCFESLDVRVNDVSITQSPGYYGYRSYIQNLMSFDESAKGTNLYLSGWITDSYVTENGIGNTEPTETNEGMRARNAWFRQDLQEGTDSPYSVSGYQMVCPLKHELYGNRVLFPPSTKIMFTFTKAPSAWYLMVPPTTVDKEKYKFHISNCVLFVKMVTLNDHIYKSLVSRMEKEPIMFHYRRLALKTEVLNSHSIYFESNNLFSDSTAPIKVYFALVKNKSLGNSYDLNPFNFLRALKVQPLNKNNEMQFAHLSHETLTLEILKQQQHENQKILEELLKFRKIAARKAKKIKELKRQRLNQIDGNESEPEGNDRSGKIKMSKGKGLPGKNVVKKSHPSNLGCSNLAEKANSDKNMEVNNSCLNLSNSSNEPKTDKKSCTETRASKIAASKFIKNFSEVDDLVTDEDDYDYEDSFIDDNTDDSDISDSSNDYNTADSNIEPNASTSSNTKIPISNKVSKPRKLHTPPLLRQFQNLRSDEDICFVESFTLDVNSKALDQFTIPATKTSCVSDYTRFLATSGLFQNIHSADITYEMFKSGFALFSYDLSVSKTTTDPYAVPLATGGYLRVRIKFNRPPQEPLMLLILSETSETMTLDRQGRISLSYKDPIVKN